MTPQKLALKEAPADHQIPLVEPLTAPYFTAATLDGKYLGMAPDWVSSYCVVPNYCVISARGIDSIASEHSPISIIPEFCPDNVPSRARKTVPVAPQNSYATGFNFQRTTLPDHRESCTTHTKGGIWC
jgi:hypothetical protein